jgi:hypothetical protein
MIFLSCKENQQYYFNSLNYAYDDIDNRLIGNNLLITISTILSNNDINIEVFKHYFFLNLMLFSLKINKKLSVTN